jgi:hypothetical protein
MHPATDEHEVLPLVSDPYADVVKLISNPRGKSSRLASRLRYQNILALSSKL